jgi:hypothetical protein
MKAEILKIAGVKNEAEFYRKFPSEEAFMKVYGKEFKKAKRGDVIHKMQNADAPCVGKNCRGKSWSPLADISVGGGSGGQKVKVIPEWNEISTSTGYFDKDQLKGYEKEFKKNKELQTQYPGITLQHYIAAQRDAARANTQFANPERSKYFDPSTGALLPNVDNRSIDPFMRFYRGKFPTQSKISAQDVLGIYGGMPGGVSNYEKYANFGYNPELRQGGLVQAQDGIGSYTGGETMYNPQTLNFQNALDVYDLQMTGSTDAQRQAQAQKAQQAQMAAQAAKKPAGGGGGGMDMSKIMGMIGGEGGMDMSALAGMAKHGKRVPKYQNSGLGLNSPAGGTMTGMQAAETNPYMYDPLLPIGAPTAQSMQVNPNQNPPMLDPTYAGNLQQQLAGSGNLPKKDPLDAILKNTGPIGKMYGAVKKLKAEKEARKSAEQQASVSDLSLQAALSKPEQQKRTYNRPEDALVQPDQVFPSYGVGTNVLTARDGMQIGGNMTEIQNMYNPGDLYQDLGYEPLSDSEIVKQYREGGLVRRMQTGGGMPPLDFGNAGSGVPVPSWATVGNAGQMIGQGVTGNNAGGEIGGEVGGAIGMAIGGPAGKAIGQTVGAIGGGLLDRNPQKMEKAQNRTKRNVQKAAMYSMGQALQSQHSAHVRNGGDIPYAEDGWMSNDWMPQTITQFGEHKVSDLLRPDPMMDTLRTGGHLSQNKMFPQDQYALGGELKTTWGGYTESMSHNPYLPGTGETVMFRGKSHEESDGRGHTGIGVKYGEGGHDSYTDYAEYGSENADADVEVERGEPATEMIDGETGEKNMVVFGNLKIPNQFLEAIGDPKAKDKKFKHYIAGISKDEARQNKIIDKTSKQIDELDVYTPFDKLKLDGLNATKMGADMKLQNYAEIKKNASVVQDAINETAKERGVDADALAKGKIKIDKQAQKEMAKYGKEIFKAQTGTTEAANFVGPTPDDYLENLYQQAKKEKKGPMVEFFQKEFHKFYPNEAKDIILADPKVTTRGQKLGIKTHKDLEKADVNTILKTNVDNIFGDRTEQYHTKLQELRKPYTATTPAPAITKTTTPATTQTPVVPVEANKQDPWMTAVNQLAPYLRPSDVDYNVDLYPEMMAASMNQVEPVFAQSYQPQLLTPYDISYQDQLNEITAQARAAERMAGQNPAAAASILPLASGEKNKVLGEQFRQNQAQRMGVYNQNINTLNDAQLKNIGIYADQAAKQSQARSNTKAQAMEIVKSMSDKIDKNKLENKTLQTYENLYNYRFGKDGRAQNYNPLAQFDVTRGGNGTGKSSGGIAPGYEFTYDSSGNIIGTRKSKEDKDARNGSIVRALKNF